LIPVISGIERNPYRNFLTRDTNPRSWQAKCYFTHVASEIFGGNFVKDINSVLRNKRIQLADLAQEIQGLEAAATALRPIAHLLSEEENTPQNGAIPQLSIAENLPAAVVEAARPEAPERTRIRRWV
jgi:hypothetical protein